MLSDTHTQKKTKSSETESYFNIQNKKKISFQNLLNFYNQYILKKKNVKMDKGYVNKWFTEE